MAIRAVVMYSIPCSLFDSPHRLPDDKVYCILIGSINYTDAEIVLSQHYVNLLVCLALNRNNQCNQFHKIC